MAYYYQENIMSKLEFEDISIPRWKLALNGLLPDAAQKIYRVFSSGSEFVTVEAANATEAAAKSGLAKVLMIKIGARDDMTMLDRTMLMAMAGPEA